MVNRARQPIVTCSFPVTGRQAALISVLQLHLTRPAGDVLVFLLGAPSGLWCTVSWGRTDRPKRRRSPFRPLRPGQDDIESLQRLLEEKQER